MMAHGLHKRIQGWQEPSAICYICKLVMLEVMPTRFHGAPSAPEFRPCCSLLRPMPVQVFQALRSDFSSRRKDRCIRVDFSGGMVSGVDDLERMLRDAIKTTFEARAAAYDEQVLLWQRRCKAG